MEIPGLRGLGLAAALKRAVKEFVDDKMLTYAAALAYQVLFSIFPFTIFLIALLGFLNLADFFDWLLQQARQVLPRDAMGGVQDVIEQIREQEQGGLISFGIILALWSASAGVRATMDALNVAYDVEETRPAWKRYPLSIVYTLGIAIMLVAAAGLMLVGPRAIEWLAAQVGLGHIVTAVWTWLRFPIAVLLLMVAVAVVYYVAPNVEQPFQFITPGSVLAVIVWVAASLGFSYYVSNFANYSATYGSLGAVILLLLFFYISAAVMLFGAEVNAVIERHAREHGDRRVHAPEGAEKHDVTAKPRTTRGETAP